MAKGFGLGLFQCLITRATSLVLIGSSRVAGNGQRGTLQETILRLEDVSWSFFANFGRQFFLKSLRLILEFWSQDV